MRLIWICIAIISVAELPDARAARQPDHLAGSVGLETPPGQAPHRLYRRVGKRAPLALSGAPLPLVAAGSWTTTWDQDTGVPSRIYGSGIAAPGSVADADVAAAAARRHLADNLAALAPGASVDDFELVANVEHRGVRIVGFDQQHRGLPVLGGHISFRFKADRLFVVASSALPNVSVATTAVAGPGAAGRAAKRWIDGDYRTDGHVGVTRDPVIVPIISGPGQIRYAAALPVEVSSVDPVGVWTVYVGASDELIARRQTLSFAEGTVLYNTPLRYPGADRAQFAAAATDLQVDGAPQTSDSAGVVTFPGATAEVITSVVGTFAAIVNADGDPNVFDGVDEGPLATTTLSLDDGGTTTWTDSAELIDAQITAFVHASISNTVARQINPDLPFLDEQLQVRVNIGQSCNANFDGQNINFFQAGPLQNSEDISCANTARLVDVVHHEFGHALHSGTVDITGTPFDSAFSEGLSDYWAATIVNSPEMGPGFFGDEASLRPMEGPRGDTVWPQGFSGKDTHVTGVIFAGAMWDLRQALIAELGESAGVALADQLFYGAVQRAGSVFDTYVEVLAEDDDDGNLANGTPNKCLIDYAFGGHGLGDQQRLLGAGLDLPYRDGYDIAVPVADAAPGCTPPEVSSMSLTWRLRGDESEGETLPMELSGGEYRATIPTQSEGEVIEYRVTVAFADGNTRRLPLNQGSPYYEFFNGDTEEIYCHDFETDPTAEWTFGSADAQLTQFEWGVPAGSDENFDPPEAFSGSSVIGTGLQGAGTYGASRSSFAESPAVEVELDDTVHLQYRRWLGTEDAVFDQAVIYANDTEVYRNPSVPFPFTFYPVADHQWRFHTVDVSDAAFAGSIQIRYELTSDESGSGAGWNIDDFCLVRFVASVCGDGEITGNETCDDGADNSDSAADACRTTCVAPTCGDGTRDSGEECDDGNDIDDDDCTNQCVDIGGCGCRTGGGAAGGLALVALAILGLRRRRVGRRSPA